MTKKPKNEDDGGGYVEGGKFYVVTEVGNCMHVTSLTHASSLAERQQKKLSVLFVDLDQFTRINDSLGHAVGDKLLKSVAGRLKSCVRRTDTV